MWPAIEPRLVFTQNVRQALDYVAREEADAAFVFATDASILADKVEGRIRRADADSGALSDRGRSRFTAAAARARPFVAYVAGAIAQRPSSSWVPRALTSFDAALTPLSSR